MSTPEDHLIQNFQRLSTEHLIDRLESGGLTELAEKAINEVLAERNISFEAIKKATKTVKIENKAAIIVGIKYLLTKIVSSIISLGKEFSKSFSGTSKIIGAKDKFLSTVKASFKNIYFVAFILTGIMVHAAAFLGDHQKYKSASVLEILLHPIAAISFLIMSIQVLLYTLIGPAFLFYLGARHADHRPIIFLFTLLNVISGIFCIYNNAVTSGANGGDFYFLIYIAINWLIAISAAVFVRS
ncbi:MAG: hypothetical protein WA173_17645 [Pseudomonas sp.]|uniref:hypothetical protein n=1 Tax=Pseudomonas sp. TaxID=306 RepID=UPI003BB5A9EB